MPISGGVAPAGVQLLFKLAGANMQLATDQAFTKVYGGSAYAPTLIFARQRTGGASVACVGGIYDAAAKGGNAMVAAAQSWVTLANGVIVNSALAALVATTLLTNTPILSLTTGSTAACTADLFIYGVDLT
jgi:hypothetical protein